MSPSPKEENLLVSTKREGSVGKYDRLADFLPDYVDQCVASVALAAEIFWIRANHLHELGNISWDLSKEKRFLNSAASATRIRCVTVTYVDELRQSLQRSEQIFLWRLRVQELKDGHRDFDGDVVKNLTRLRNIFWLIKNLKKHKSQFVFDAFFLESSPKQTFDSEPLGKSCRNDLAWWNFWKNTKRAVEENLLPISCDKHFVNLKS